MELFDLWGTPTAHPRTHTPRQVHHGKQLANQVAQLMSSAAASPARTSARPAKVPGSVGLAAAYGRNTPELLARFDPASFSWRTSQLCLDGALSVFSETWPRSGMMRNGTAYLLPPLVLLTDGIGSGSWPTPSASLGDHAGLVSPRKAREGGILVEAVPARSLWPTPTAGDSRNSRNATASRSPDSNHHSGTTLSDFITMYPTPQARDSHNRSGQAHRYLVEKRWNLQDRNAADGITGSLNPEWVGWLMGFPLGWTDLDR